jgi:single-strand selective monofunctional uracil DNA glycosylase
VNRSLASNQPGKLVSCEHPNPNSPPGTCERLLRAARRLRLATNRLSFSAPVNHVYNPLTYAWKPYEAYVRRFGTGPKRVVFLGMNPGPFGMVQTGVPFGEISAVRDWLKIEAAVQPPPCEHPRRLISGFACARSEVSGKRLWGLMAQRFGTPQNFFAQHIILNYCPLSFLEGSGRNRTPDKLPAAEKAALFAACDEHLRAVIGALQPEWLIGIGDFALKRIQQVFTNGGPRLGRILHPSPASPAANRNWALSARRQLEELGVW